MFEKCPNCLKRVIKGSKFCTHCGERMPLVAKEKKRKINRKFSDVDFTDGKKVFKRYKNYFLDRLKDPMVSMKKSMNKESFQFGVIQLIVFVLLNSLTVSIYSANLSKLSLFSGGMVLQVFFLINMVITLYVTTNYLKKVPTSVQTIVSRIGGLATPQLVLSVLLYFSVLLRIDSIYYLILALLVLISTVIISFYLLNVKNNSRIPNFYIVVFALVLLLILQVLMYSAIIRFSTNPQIYPELIKNVLN